MRDYTSEELKKTVEDLLAYRFTCGTPADQLNLNFFPAVDQCDGPNRIVCYRFHTYPWMANPNHMTHGGMIAALFDNAMGLTTSTFYQVMTPTITMTVNYARPVPLDTDIIVKVHAVHTGGTSAQLTAEMYFPDDPGCALATASGVYYVAHANK